MKQTLTNNPMTRRVLLAIFVGLFITVAIIGGMWATGVSNGEIALRARGNAQQQRMKLTYDATWKILRQQAGVTEEYRDSFAKIYPDLMKARYGEGGSGSALLSFVQESNPQFDSSLYGKLSDSIEAQQSLFLQSQELATDIAREHETMRLQFPSSLVVGNRAPMKFAFVTSSQTETAFGTGKVDDIELFGSKN